MTSMHKCRKSKFKGTRGMLTYTGRFVNKDRPVGKAGNSPASVSRQALQRMFLPPFGTAMSTKICDFVATRGRLGNVPYRTGP